MATNNVQIFFKNFGNFEITKYFDPESLKTLAVNPNGDVADFKITNNNELQTCIIPGVVEDTVLKVNASLIKRDNKRIYDALQIVGSELGEVLWSTGNETTTFSKCVVSVKMNLMGNPSEFADVSVKFHK
jgi:hypothetical protein